MSDTDDVNSRTASVDIKTFGMSPATINVDRDNTSYVPMNLYKDPLKIKDLSNVCIEIPENWVSDYKRMVSSWAFNKNSQKAMNLKFSVTKQ
jgi:hypothetical protein